LYYMSITMEGGVDMFYILTILNSKMPPKKQYDKTVEHVKESVEDIEQLRINREILNCLKKGYIVFTKEEIKRIIALVLYLIEKRMVGQTYIYTENETSQNSALKMFLHKGKLDEELYSLIEESTRIEKDPICLNKSFWTYLLARYLSQKPTRSQMLNALNCFNEHVDNGFRFCDNMMSDIITNYETAENFGKNEQRKVKMYMLLFYIAAEINGGFYFVMFYILLFIESSEKILPQLERCCDNYFEEKSNITVLYLFIFVTIFFTIFVTI